MRKDIFFVDIFLSLVGRCVVFLSLTFPSSPMG